MTQDRLQYLLNRYLDQQTTPEELEEFEQWFGQQQQQPDLLQPDDKMAVEAYSRPLLEALHRQMEQSRRPQARLIALRKMAVAAAVLAVCCIGIFFLANKTGKSRQAIASITHDSLQQPRSVNIYNASDSIQQFRLQDGSTILLSSHSRLQYEQPFSNNKRNIHLTGKAFFKVAKDSLRPFTVFSGDISTTALGTAFTITAFEDAPGIRVQLHEGKIVVRSVIQDRHTPIADVFLLPGQELAYNTKTSVTRIYDRSIAGQPVSHSVKPVSPGSITGMEATFEQEPLANVLRKMAKGYGVQLQYNKAELQLMDYSGKISKQDSLAKVITRIALLHRLTITKTQDGYRISKNQ